MSAYSVTAYLPGPRNTYSDYTVKERHALGSTPETSYHLDDFQRRTGRQYDKLERLHRKCEDNVDTCNMFYNSAHKREVELSDNLYNARLLVASMPTTTQRKRYHSHNSLQRKP